MSRAEKEDHVWDWFDLSQVISDLMPALASMLPYDFWREALQGRSQTKTLSLAS